MTNIKKNLGYQTLYQILNVGLPLITAPFLARVLGAEPLGVMSYTTSVVHYFTLFAMMGLANYGTRSVALVKKSKQKRSDVFSQIFYLQLLTTGIAFIAYILYMLCLCKDNIVISWIQSLAIIACFFDINWFFFGVEEFRIPVIRGMIIRVVSVALMLLLVKGPDDLWIYAVLLIGSPLISQIILWFYVPKFISLKKPDIEEIKKHFGPNVKLFIPLLAMSVYHIMDKTMLGALSTYTQSGYYYNADKVINIPIGLLTGVGTVMLPRMSALAGADMKTELNAMFNTTIRGIGLVSAAMCCGIAAIAKEFTPFFFGPGYDECITLIICLAPVLFIKGLSLISRNLFLIPNKMENKLSASVFAGAVLNIIVNALLIPSMGALGAVIGTLAAEIVSCIWQYASLSKEVKCINSLMSAIVYFALGVCMYFGVRFIADHIIAVNIVKIFIEIITGVIIYSALCIALWTITRNKSAIEFFKSQLKRK